MDPKDLKALQKYWNSRLKASGFRDIEDEHERLINHDVSFSYMFEDELAVFKGTEEYFEQARHWLHTDYLKDREKFIWEHYCDGKTHEEISKITGLSRQRVTQIVEDIDRRLMKRGR